jgi:hypothetical protein
VDDRIIIVLIVFIERVRFVDKLPNLEELSSSSYSANFAITTESFLWVLLRATKRPLQVNPSLQRFI